jgi:hypothetical protein
MLGAFPATLRPMHPLETYLSELRDSRVAGVPETSGYTTLAKLIDEIGRTLKPKVRCIINPKNKGAGIPDGGLFTVDLLKRNPGADPLAGVLPDRGAIEVKSTSDDAWLTADSPQVTRYWEKYGHVLVTNYRDFVMVGRDAHGKPVKLETYRLAESELAFWAAAGQPRKASEFHGERFAEYLKRVLLHAAPLNNPRDVAFFLASYARDARARVEAAGDLPALTAVRLALEEALGMKFEAGKGEHFFRSTLVQTLFYGVFSAWVLWHKENPQRQDAFDWKAAAWTLHVPMIKALFEQVATPTKLGPLGLVEVLDWTAAALNRVNRPAFFEKFLETHAVQYFYEPFLEAFDPELRKQLGVWYTPPEIVAYQVARVDTVLREELDIPDGLADPRVFVLDPCCGTGAYLVEALRRIQQTLKEHKGEDALATAELKKAAMKRVFGFEIMPAPFVVAHLQMGLLLQSLAVPLDDAQNERAGIFLTNALTGWDFAGDNPKLANWPELEAERKGAGKVKQEKPILVILGNPPYNAYAGVSPEEEQGLVEPYKEGLVKQWGIKKFNLDDLYVRFFRLAERRIAEKTGKGIVCFISNHSWISDPSFVVLRQHLLNSFDRFWIENMHGNRKISEYAPDGRTSETVFALAGFSPGIQQGVAISLWAKTGKKQKKTVLFRDDLNAAKAADRRAHLLASLKAKKFDAKYEKADPSVENRFSFRPSDVATHYLAWPKLTDLCQSFPLQGMDEDRANSLIEFDKERLTERMRKYFGHDVEWAEFQLLQTGLSRKSAAFEPKAVRMAAQESDEFSTKNLRRYLFRPYDVRWCYYTPVPNVWKRSRPELWRQSWAGNAFLLSRPAGVAAPEGVPFTFTKNLLARDCMRGHAVAFPLCLRSARPGKPKKDDGNGEFSGLVREAAATYDADGSKDTANLSSIALAYLAKLGIKNPDADPDTAALLWMHALAIGYSPAYLIENADGIRQDWPRIPLPKSKAALLASAKLGQQVAALLDTETPIPGVDAGKVRPDLVKIAVVTRLTKETLNLSLTAGWGHAGKGGVTMPGKGKLVRNGDSYDVYLNNAACWQNIPAAVWDYTIGGYQVIKKWLSYREFELLGRALTPDEAREVTHMARRIAAIIALQPALDANYRAIADAAYPWEG